MRHASVLLRFCGLFRQNLEWFYPEIKVFLVHENGLFFEQTCSFGGKMRIRSRCLRNETFDALHKVHVPVVNTVPQTQFSTSFSPQPRERKHVMTCAQKKKLLKASIHGTLCLLHLLLRLATLISCAELSQLKVSA